MTGRVGEMSEGDGTCLTTSQHPSRWHPPWPSKVCTTREDPDSERLAKENPETNRTTMKPKTVSQQAEQFSWLPLPSCSPPGRSFPVNFLALSALTSPWTIHI